jgi:hypothetical protein
VGMWRETPTVAGTQQSQQPHPLPESRPKGESCDSSSLLRHRDHLFMVQVVNPIPQLAVPTYPQAPPGRRREKGTKRSSFLYVPTPPPTGAFPPALYIVTNAWLMMLRRQSYMEIQSKAAAGSE